MAKTKQNTESLQNSNRALWLALQSAQKRNLLNSEVSFGTARQISIAASKYYLALTGQMDKAELKAAIEAVFNYEGANSITAV